MRSTACGHKLRGTDVHVACDFRSQDIDELRTALAYIFPDQTDQELQDFIGKVRRYGTQGSVRVRSGV